MQWSGSGLLTMCVGAPSGRAVDLTGTWEARSSVTPSNSSGKFKSGVKDDIMEITQAGADLNIIADDFEFLYNGQVIDDAANPAFKGQAGFIECRDVAGE